MNALLNELIAKKSAENDGSFLPARDPPEAAVTRHLA